MPLLSLYEHLVAQRYWAESGADEIHRVRTADGVRVAVKRFHPAPGAPSRAHPILCIPGLGADSHNFDAPAPSGLAGWLAEKGFDVWVIDLRGTGMSDVPPGTWSDITFDDFFRLDVAAALDHIVETTGAPSVMTIGHSMGGMILYALLGMGLGQRIHGAVTLCSPVGFARGLHFPRLVQPLVKPVFKLGDVVPGVHAGRLLKLFAPVVGRKGFGRLTAHLAHPDNLDGAYVRRLAHRAVQNVPRGVLKQFRTWVTEDRFCSADGHTDYRARLAGVTTPALVVAAPADKLATPRSVLRAGDLLARAEVLLCGQRQGFSVDYGHIDIVFGQAAHDEVFPRLLTWLVRHDDSTGATAPHDLPHAHVH